MVLGEELAEAQQVRSLEHRRRHEIQVVDVVQMRDEAGDENRIEAEVGPVFVLVDLVRLHFEMLRSLQAHLLQDLALQLVQFGRRLLRPRLHRDDLRRREQGRMRILLAVKRQQIGVRRGDGQTQRLQAFRTRQRLDRIRPGQRLAAGVVELHRAFFPQRPVDAERETVRLLCAHARRSGFDIRIHVAVRGGIVELPGVAERTGDGRERDEQFEWTAGRGAIEVLDALHLRREHPVDGIGGLVDHQGVVDESRSVDHDIDSGMLGDDRFDLIEPRDVAAAMDHVRARCPQRFDARGLRLVRRAPAQQDQCAARRVRGDVLCDQQAQRTESAADQRGGAVAPGELAVDVGIRILIRQRHIGVSGLEADIDLRMFHRHRLQRRPEPARGLVLLRHVQFERRTGVLVHCERLRRRQ